MKIEQFIPQVRTTFRVEENLEEIHQKLKLVTESIGLSHIKAEQFYFTRLKNRSNAYRIIGELNKGGADYEISYHIRLHRIVQLVYWLSIPLSLILFFVSGKEMFSDLLNITDASLAVRLGAHLFILLTGFIGIAFMIQKDMNQSDEVIKEVFGKGGNGSLFFVKND